MPPPKLLVALPVYNESDSIRHVIGNWTTMLDATVGDYVILAINDGSTDDSGAILENLQSAHGDRLEVRSRGNRGHGQSCLEAYLVALERAIPYILQIDSDGQSDPRYLSYFWGQREDYDVIYGKRRRLDGPLRSGASLVLRHLLRVLEGVDCVDANVPYRLMNTHACQDAIRSIPPAISLANVALSVLLRRNPKLRHGVIRIDFPPRYGGEPSVPLTRFVLKGCELFAQLRELRKIPTL
jgi:glycosyltransferase involved in cell wall biosynthesis